MRVAGDDAEDVVEVVGDPAGEQADRLQLLGLSQLVLQPDAVGDVGADEQFRRGTLQFNPFGGGQEGQGGAVLGLRLELDVPETGALPLRVLRNRPKSEGHRIPADQLLTGVAQFAQERLVHLEDPAVGEAEYRLDRRAELEGLGEARFAFPEAPFGALTGGDVADDGLEAVAP